MPPASPRDFAAGLLFIVIGGGFALGALNYPLGRSAAPGPGYFPLALGLALVAMGAVLAVRGLGVAAPDGGRIGPVAWRPLACVLAAVGLFGLSLRPLGLVVAVPLLVTVASLARTPFRPAYALGLAAVLTLMSWGIFVLGLRLNLPVWPAFFR